MMRAKWVPINAVAGEPSGWNPRLAGSREQFRYIDISSIDTDEKRIVSVAWISPKDAPSRARQLVRAGDVLVSTVRPNLNAVAIVPGNLEGATASTGFAVLRPNPTTVHPRYLYQWTRTPAFVRGLVGRATGASYPAVTERAVRDSKMLLPPLAEQRRIASLLDKADAIRRKRQESLRLLDEFLRSAFLQIFGDPVRNDQGWETAQASFAIKDIEAGSSVNGVERKRTPDEWGVLKISAVTSGWYNPDECKVVEAPPRQPVVPQRGDLLLSRANTRELVAATCLVDRHDPRLFLPDKLWRVTPQPEVATVEYLCFLFANSRFRKTLARHATGTSGSMLNISQKKLLRLQIPVPPIPLQQRFAALVQDVFETRGRFIASSRSVAALYGSLAQLGFHDTDRGADHSPDTSRTTSS